MGGDGDVDMFAVLCVGCVLLEVCRDPKGACHQQGVSKQCHLLLMASAWLPILALMSWKMALQAITVDGDRASGSAGGGPGILLRQHSNDVRNSKNSQDRDFG